MSYWFWDTKIFLSYTRAGVASLPFGFIYGLLCVKHKATHLDFYILVACAITLAIYWNHRVSRKD